ncbi:hypothetical protein IMZ48_12585, partial [Candidatus Bathyarchaeota archaeon]|nr:hypothetical protein [Candidatus Bathyarchaeota archaeon]
FTISRGWSCADREGDVLQAPPAAFRAQRDIDQFLSRNEFDEWWRSRSRVPDRINGFLPSASILRTALKKLEAEFGSVNRRLEITCDVIEGFQAEFDQRLGVSEYTHGLPGVAPSRFSDTDANGLWAYSPYLCGVGLVEGLELSYPLGMFIWEVMPEPLLFVHLHNMLVETGRLKAPIPMYLFLQIIFRREFFLDGVVPKTKFHKALYWHFQKMRARGGSYDRYDRTTKIKKRPRSPDDHAALSVSHNFTYNVRSALGMCRAADWDPARISQDDVDPQSMLGVLLLNRTKIVVDPATGESKLEDTALVRSAKGAGISDEKLLKVANHPREKYRRPDPTELFGKDPEDLTADEMASILQHGFSKWTTNSPDNGVGKLDSADYLFALREDFSGDILGDKPRSGINYLWLTCYFMSLFTQAEAKLKAKRNSAYIRRYEGVKGPSREKRLGLMHAAICGENEECLEVMMETMNEYSLGIASFAFWDKLDMKVLKRMFKDMKGGEDGTSDEE